jgi:hypothetical protein
VWFLAGIFGQYVLKIRNHSNCIQQHFEPVVQPALGILMIGSAAGAMFKKEMSNRFRKNVEHSNSRFKLGQIKPMQR